MSEVVIVSAKRTPVGSFQGSLSGVAATELGSTAIRAALSDAQVAGTEVDEVIMGHVLTAGVGQAPARQAALGAGISENTPCMTINKVCGSGLKSVMLAADSIRLGHSKVAVAGGQENMTLAPHLMEKSRAGYRMGHTQVMDSMIKDGLWDPYNNFHMGNAAEICAKEFKFSREAQDAFAKESYDFAHNAQKQGWFEKELTKVEIKSRKGTTEVLEDEEPGRARFDKMAGLRPAFDKEGTITAANASKINDGAAATVLMSAEKATEKGAKPLAKIRTYATFAHEPKWFTTAPVTAIKRSLEMANLSAGDIDLWEINEAFSVVTMAATEEFKIPRDKVNVNGGAIAIGHPIGASGARILTTLIHGLHTHDKQFGLATLCIGGGEAVSMIIERV